MKRVVADVPGRTVVVEPGVLSGELKAATADAGLAPVLGCNPSVGVTGLTIGGGIGWFLGTHGAACDNLLWRPSQRPTATCFARMPARTQT